MVKILSLLLTFFSTVPSLLIKQFVIFKLLSYCFQETIGFDVKVWFQSRPVLRLISRYNKPSDIKKGIWEKTIHLHETSWTENYKLERRTFLSTIRSLGSKLLDCTNYDLTQTLLFGNTSHCSCKNLKIINASIDYILSSKRFDEPLCQINSFISKPEFNQQFSFLHIYLLLSLVILYSQVLSSMLLSGDCVILFVYVFFCLYFTLSEL